MPWVAQNNRHRDGERIPSLDLKVVAAECGVLRPDDGDDDDDDDEGEGKYGSSRYAFLSSDDVEGSQQFVEAIEKNKCFVYVRTHPQFLVLAKLHPRVPKGAIVLTEVQRLNFEVTVGEETFPWSLYLEEEKPLMDMLLEVRPRFVETKTVMDGKPITSALNKALFQNIITVHERIAIVVQGIEYILRVLEVRVEEDENEKESDYVIPDPFRGVVEASTQIYLTKDMGEQEHLYELVNEKPYDRTTSVANQIDIYCNDGEYFPVKKKLMQPAIALTKAVLDTGQDRPRVDVDIDCCTFDRVLLYLISEAQGTGAQHKIELEHVGDLLDAAKKLKIIGLQRLCEKMIGDFETRIREEGIPYSEVVQRNSKGECLLIIDNMVINVTQWLPEHPGGNNIIPNQALNKDATVFFELYHSSRQSFFYLKQFYIGQLQHKDQGNIPLPDSTLSQKATASNAFLQELREFMRPDNLKAYKSF